MTSRRSQWRTATDCAVGAAILNFILCYTKNLYNLRSYSTIFLGGQTDGELNSITTQAMAFGVLLFPCLFASQLHSTIHVVLLRSPFILFTPAAMQPGHSQQSIGKEQAAENVTSIGSTDGTHTIHVRDFLRISYFLFFSKFKAFLSGGWFDGNHVYSKIAFRLRLDN